MAPDHRERPAARPARERLELRAGVPEVLFRPAARGGPTPRAALAVARGGDRVARRRRRAPTSRRPRDPAETRDSSWIGPAAWPGRGGRLARARPASDASSSTSTSPPHAAGSTCSSTTAGIPPGFRRSSPTPPAARPDPAVDGLARAGTRAGATHCWTSGTPGASRASRPTSCTPTRRADALIDGIARAAARRHLVVDFHGCTVPRGL